MQKQGYSSNILQKASAEIQSHLKEQSLNYVSIKEAQRLMNKKNIAINLKSYFSSLNISKKTEIIGGQRYIFNYWRIYNKEITNEHLSETFLLMDFFYHRLKKARSSFSFMSFFLVIILIIGLLGSFLGSIEFLNNEFDAKTFNISLIGYAIVLACSSTSEYLYPSFDDEEIAYKRSGDSIRMFGFTTLLMVIILAISSYLTNNIQLKISLSAFVALVSIILWFIGNARYGVLIKKYPMQIIQTDDTGGGKTDKQPIGDIPDEFKS